MRDIVMRKMNEIGHFTEISMAATTALFDPFEIEWSALFCRLLEIPRKCLPTVIDTDSDKFGHFKDFGLNIRICSDASCSIIGENMINRFGFLLIKVVSLTNTVNLDYSKPLKKWRCKANNGNGHIC